MTKLYQLHREMESLKLEIKKINNRKLDIAKEKRQLTKHLTLEKIKLSTRRRDKLSELEKFQVLFSAEMEATYNK